jgi:hypothetical protein
MRIRENEKNENNENLRMRMRKMTRIWEEDGRTRGRESERTPRENDHAMPLVVDIVL